jgi:WD40 repeat protein
VWDGRNGRQLNALSGNQGEVLDVAISPDGTSVVSASTDGTARVWDTGTESLQGYLYGHANYVDAVDFSPDGTAIVTASLDRTAQTWRPNGQQVATLAGHGGTVTDAVFLPDGYAVVTAGEDGTVRVWDAGTRPDFAEDAVTPPEPPATTTTSPDGDTTATASGNDVLLERADGTTSNLTGHRLKVTSVAFSPDGTRLLSASRDHDVILWDVATGKQLRVLRGHFGTVSDARFSPDGRWIVTAGPRTVGLWWGSEGELVRLLTGPPGPFTAVSFLPGSRTIVASSAGDVVSAYDCRICGEIPDLLTLADERLAGTGRELTPEERELYFD